MPHSAFIPASNEHLRALGCVNRDFVAFVQSRSPQKRATGQQWAEVCFVPTWAGQSKNGPAYRFVATREALRQQLALPGHEEAEVDPDSVETPAGVRYKIRGIVTNRTLDGNELIAWYRERCGRSDCAVGPKRAASQRSAGLAEQQAHRKTDLKGSIAPEVRSERHTRGHFLQNPQVTGGLLRKNPAGPAEMCQKMATINLRPIGGGGLWKATPS